jgi:hypothetical protein
MRLPVERLCASDLSRTDYQNNKGVVQSEIRELFVLPRDLDGRALSKVKYGYFLNLEDEAIWCAVDEFMSFDGIAWGHINITHTRKRPFARLGGLLFLRLCSLL